MKTNSIIYILLLITVIIACEKETDIDSGIPGLNQIPADSLEITMDTIGIHPFLGEKYLVIISKEQRMLYYAKESNIYSVEAIALPESDNTSKDILPPEIQLVLFDCDQTNYFFGYASAIDVNGNTLVVAERRASEKFVNSKSDNFFLTKNTAGIWEQTDFFKYAPYGNEFVNSRPMIGKTAAGKIVVKGKGLLVSDGDLQSWTHYPHAFDSLLNKDYEECGPVFTYSSRFGMFFGTGQYIDKTDTIYGAIISVDPDQGIAKEVNSKWVAQIQKFDGSYKDLSQLTTPVFYSVEHDDLIANRGDIIGVGISKDKVYQFVYNYKEGDTFDSLVFKIGLTNITGSTVRHSPVGIDYNPVTKRFEMIHSSPYYLEIYSMAPEDLLSNKLNIYGSAEWRKEAVILDRNVSVRGQGMYPVGNITDVENGVQRIYIYAGDEYPGRAGIFEITRTLNTDELSGFVADRRKILASQQY